MANPQKENGFTAIANEIRDEIFLREFKPTHKDILELLWRFSYGCMGRKFVYIDNYKYFEIIGISKTHVKERLAFLINNKVLIHIKEFNVIVFNKNFDEWTIPKVPDYIKRKQLLKELLNSNLCYKFGNEVTEIVTKLRIKGNGVTDKQELFLTGSPTGEGVVRVPKESIKESIKYKEEEEEKLARVGKVFKFFHSNISSTPGQYQYDEIHRFLDEGFEPELIIESMKDSLGAKYNKWKLLLSILTECSENKILTLEQYNAHKKEKAQANSTDKPNNKTQSSGSQTEMLQKVKERLRGGKSP